MMENEELDGTASESKVNVVNEEGKPKKKKKKAAELVKNETEKKEGEEEEKEEEEREAKAIHDLRFLRRLPSVLPEIKEEIIPEKPGRGSVLMTELEEPDIEAIFEEFEKSAKNRLNEEAFMRTLKEKVTVRLSDSDLHNLFMKMDANNDSFVDWDEFLSHILLEFQDQEMANVHEELLLPVDGVPRMLRSEHRHPISRVHFCPTVGPDRTTNYLNGKYMTGSRDGVINYWSLDFEYENSVQSESPDLKISSTWVTDFVCMPDINIVCTSSTERDLRFYDAAARKFQLRVIFTSWEYSIIRMYYYFDSNVENDSVLVMGDSGGHIRILTFNSKGKGPFHAKLGVEVIHMRYESVAKGEMHGLRLVEFRNVHSEWIKQVYYYAKLKSFMSCAPCPDPSVFLRDLTGTKGQYRFNVPSGVNCFSVVEDNYTIVTGGPDCTVRVWNVFVPGKPVCVFEGHHTSVISVVLQDRGQRIFSLSKDRCIKVWDVPTLTCVQTYISMPADLGEHIIPTTFYNPLNRYLIVAGAKIAILVLGAVVDVDRSDGYTHTKSVTKALYNPLFKCVVSVGLDSCIMVWDPWTGKRMFLLRNAHTHILYGETTPVEITAATFDPTYQFLLTGARDGTLKVWIFNTGTCVRTMNIEANCEVTSVVWLPHRILAVGWNRHVIEFAEKGIYASGKAWETRHTDDVLCTACRSPQALATSSYNGELILWRLETGQAYRRYQVANPAAKYMLTSLKESKAKKRSAADLRGKSSMSSTLVSRRASSRFDQMRAARRMSREAVIVKGTMATNAESAFLAAQPLSAKEKAKKARRVSVIQLPASGMIMRPLSVHAMLFLETRPMHVEIGTLFVALENGAIQVWSHHNCGGFLTQFFAIHCAGDYVVSMATDAENEFLFTGTTMGYIKIWLMKNYMVPNAESIKICMPIYRLQFPFLWYDRIEGRAKRSLREQLWPLLLSSHRAHLVSVNHIEYLPSCKLVITCSTDTTVRIWTLGGRYMGTLGMVHPWPTLYPGVEPQTNFRIAPEIKRVGSSTTMKVLKGGEVSFTIFASKQDDIVKDLPRKLIKSVIHGDRLKRPYLGNYFKLPDHTPPAVTPILDSLMTCVPVYCHIKTDEVDEVERPPTPQSVIEVRGVKTKGNAGRSTAKARAPSTKGHSNMDK